MKIGSRKKDNAPEKSCPKFSELWRDLATLRHNIKLSQRDLFNLGTFTIFYRNHFYYKRKCCHFVIVYKYDINLKMV